LVDDDKTAQSLMRDLVEDEGFSADVAGSLEDARASLEQRPPDIILLDLILPDGTGLDLLESVEADAPHAEVVLITGNATLETAIEGLRKGLTDYLIKPVDVEHLRAVLARVARARELREELEGLRGQLRELGRFGRIVGRSKAMQVVYNRISRVAPTDASVLISGESGTGKELAAQTIHELSRRKKGPFHALNCGAVPENLMESELFGHERGAFTGADRRHRGYFERSTKGTLLLDEITETPPELQVKLLRVLETGEITRLGGEEVVEVDVRVIAATNKNPEEAIAEGKLREDLSYRLKVFEIEMPPLRNRPEDIELGDYPWPGNVRELKNAVHSAHILSDEVIEPDCLAPEITGDKDIQIGTGNTVHVRLGASLAEAERRMILSTLDHCAGDKERAAEILGVSIRTIYNRLKEYNHASA
jgi:DNA-binding NtrC family response regulator